MVEKEEINYDILEKEKSKSRNDALSVIAEKEVEKFEFSQEMTKGKKDKKIRKQRKRKDKVQTTLSDSEPNIDDVILDFSTPMCH